MSLPDLMPWSTSQNAHRNNFDFLRLALAVAVILSHSYPIVTGNNETEPLYRLIKGDTIGGVAVDAFFIISGYLITQSWLNTNDLRKFLTKRVRRVYPGFIVGMLVTAVVIVPLVHDPKFPLWKWTTVRDWFTTTLTLWAYSRRDVLLGLPMEKLLNASTWTVRYEFLCYLILAAAGLAGLLRKRGPLLALFALLMALFAWQWWVGWPDAVMQRLGWTGSVKGWLKMVGPLEGTRFLACFTGGCAFHLWRDRIPCRWWLALLSLAGLVLAARAWPFGLFLAMPVFGTYLILYLAFLPIPGLWNFAKHGDFSYGTYVYAFPIQQTILFYHRDLTPVGLFTVAAPLSVLAGAISWHAVEKRFLKRGSRAGRAFEVVSLPIAAAVPSGSTTPDAR